MRLAPFTAALALGTAALLLAGCSGGDGGSTGGATLNPEDSPLAAYFEKMGGDPEDQSAQAARSEEIVAACMQEQGFEYTPQDYGDLTAKVEDENQPDWTSLEFAEQYGYGATTGDELAAATDEGDEDAFVDANADYVASMSETEQAAYTEALYGSQATEEPVEGEEPTEWDWTTAGCQGKAQHEVYEEGQAWADPQFKDLTKELGELYEDATSSEEVVAAKKAWSECMAKEGYDFDGPDDASQSIYDAIEKIPGAEDGTQDKAALDELKTTEIATAVADRTCQQSTKYDDALLRSQFALEQAFVDTHKDELEAMVAASSKDAG
jgi:hypothetical protein